MIFNLLPMCAHKCYLCPRSIHPRRDKGSFNADRQFGCFAPVAELIAVGYRCHWLRTALGFISECRVKGFICGALVVVAFALMTHGSDHDCLVIHDFEQGDVSGCAK